MLLALIVRFIKIGRLVVFILIYIFWLILLMVVFEDLDHTLVFRKCSCCFDILAVFTILWEDALLGSERLLSH